MGRWRKAALACTMAAAAAGGAGNAPSAYGQTRLLRTQSPHAIDVIIGGGSRIGVSIRDVGESDLKNFKGVSTGVVVESVSTDSPAARAGIRANDVIVEFDGERVRSARQLTRLVHETPVERSVAVVLLRDGQRTTVNVTPEAGGSSRLIERFSDDLGDFSFKVAPRVPRPPTPPSPPSPPPTFRFDELPGRSGALGVTVDTLSTQLAEYFGVKEGVLVTSVYDNSVAAKAGVKAGDVITSLNGSPVDAPADLRRRMGNLNDGEEFTLQVMRDKKPVTLKGKVERPERRRTSHTAIL